MFRAVSIPAGTSEVVFAYRPLWLTPALLIGGIAWLVALIALGITSRLSGAGSKHSSAATDGF